MSNKTVFALPKSIEINWLKVRLMAPMFNDILFIHWPVKVFYEDGDSIDCTEKGIDEPTSGSSVIAGLIPAPCALWVALDHLKLTDVQSQLIPPFGQLTLQLEHTGAERINLILLQRGSLRGFFRYRVELGF